MICDSVAWRHVLYHKLGFSPHFHSVQFVKIFRLNVTLISWKLGWYINVKFRSLHIRQYVEFAFSIWGHLVFRQFRIFCRKFSSSNPFRLLLGFLWSFGDEQKIISYVVVEPYSLKTATVKIYTPSQAKNFLFAT